MTDHEKIVAEGVIHRFTGSPATSSLFNWKDVPIEAYDGGGAISSKKRVLVGPREGATNFALRYFEVAPGGQTSLDRHAHDHAVIIIKGRARVKLGLRVVEMGYGDVVYIPPFLIHQFECLGDDPLGMFCVNPPQSATASGL